jgi:ectoine hydroxylase-related dioxygenase (phytanoyl-CoA dioxygenase family)
MPLNWVELIEEQGFAVIPKVLDRKEVDRLFGELGRADLPRSRAGVRHAMKLPAVAELAGSATLLGIAQQILGGGAFPFRATLFDKSPTANWLVVWHQDTALPLRERRETPGWGPWSVKEGVNYSHAPASALEQVLALRVHLDDSTSENGPLRVLPGTHTRGLLTDVEIHDLSGHIEGVECVVPRGGVLGMRALIVHASSKSQSGDPRRVLHIEYAASRKMADGLELAVA